jgi:uncharacterized protein YndB with AHSA1/START domain
MSQKTKVKKDLEDKSITISREFKAPVEMVWRAYTEKEFLDKWWGPSPWRAETKSMEFREGGHWLYAMVSPENQKHWAKMNYSKINKHHKIEKQDFFCDETGKENDMFPPSNGSVVFTKTESGTNVDYKLKFTSQEGLDQLIQMGFEQGMSMCLEQLETLL